MTDLGMGGGKSRHREETRAWVGSSPNGQVHASQWATIHSALGKRVEWVSVSTGQQHSLQVRALGTAIRHVTSKAGSGGG